MSNYFLIKGPLGGFFLCYRSYTERTLAKGVVAYQKILKKRDNVIVVSLDERYWGTRKREMIEFLEEKGMSHYTTVFIGDYPKSEKENIYRLFPKCVFIGTAKIEQVASANEREWIRQCIVAMENSPECILGQIETRMNLKGSKLLQEQNEIKLKEAQDALRNYTPSSVSGVSYNIETIRNMKWIESIEETDGDSLVLRTTAMACSHVPNISNYMYIDDIKTNSIAYKIAKYQFLGKKFIVMPNEYIIPTNFNIFGRKIDDITVTENPSIRKLIEKYLWFHGTACHIGHGHICSGEFATAISQAPKTGMDLFLLNFEAFLRSINLTDSAGRRCFYLPMGDNEGNIEVWPALEASIKKGHGESLNTLVRTTDGFEEFLKRGEIHSLNLTSDDCSGWLSGYYEIGEAACLDLIKQREPHVYEEIMRMRGCEV